MAEARIERCADCSTLERVDRVVRQMGVITTNEGVEALANGSPAKASELIGVGRNFINMAGELVKLIVSNCREPRGGVCTADGRLIGTINQICEDIIFAKPELGEQSEADDADVDDQAAQSEQDKCDYCEGDYVCQWHSGVEGSPAYEG